jgi:redox-sensing transcriptional repressor
VDVRKVDLAVELQILSFHEHRKSSLIELNGTARPKGPAATGRAADAPLRGRRGAGSREVTA